MEAVKELADEVRALQEELHNLVKLKENVGFKELLEIANDQIRARTDAILLAPLTSWDKALEQEYSKGEVHGMKLLVAMTDIRIADLQERITDGLKKLETKDEHSTDDDDFSAP